MDTVKLNRRALHDTPLCPVLKTSKERPEPHPCAGPLVLNGADDSPLPDLHLFCCACGRVSEVSRVDYVRAVCADSAFARASARQNWWDPKPSRHPAHHQRWLPGIARRVDGENARVLQLFAAMRLPVAVTIACAVATNAGARITGNRLAVVARQCTVRARNVLLRAGFTETTVCNRPAFMWAR